MRRSTTCGSESAITRRGMAGDQAEPGLLHARTLTVDECQLPDRDVHHLLMHELLDPLQERLALLAVQLGRLVLEERVDVRIAAVHVGAPRDDVRLQTRRRVAERAAGGIG